MGLANIIDAVFRQWIRLFLNSTNASKKFIATSGLSLLVDPAAAVDQDEISGLKKISNHIKLGAWGEQVAAKELKRRGFKILYRNYRGQHGGEVDLVCRDRETLVFVEVKTRSSEKYSRPLNAVNRKKQKLIQRGALSWLQLLRLPDLTFRFDVVEVIATKPPEVRVIENAFSLDISY